MLTGRSNMLTLSRVAALLAALVPAVGRAQHMPHDPAADSARYHLGAMATQGLDIDGFGLEQICLHEVFLSIPSVRYTDKAEGNRKSGCGFVTSYKPT